MDLCLFFYSIDKFSWWQLLCSAQKNMLLINNILKYNSRLFFAESSQLFSFKTQILFGLWNETSSWNSGWTSPEIIKSNILSGAGPVGLTLSLLLRKFRVPFTLIERNPTLTCINLVIRLLIEPISTSKCTLYQLKINGDIFWIIRYWQADLWSIRRYWTFSSF